MVARTGRGGEVEAVRGGKSRRSRTGRSIAVACLLMACAGCDGAIESPSAADPAAGGWTEAEEITYTSDFPVQPDLTEAHAQARTLEYLAATIDVLPGAVWLTPEDTFWDGGKSIPTDPAKDGSCLLDKKVLDAPRKLMVDYLLHGTTGSKAEYLALIKAKWEQLGWNTGYKIGWEVVREPSDVVQAQTPDHYTLVTQQEAEGRRAIYVTSPCFPHTAVGAGPIPAEIRQR